MIIRTGEEKLKARHPRKMLSLSDFKADQKGITGLETAIVLIAFVVVASVFAFAVLSTGLTSSQKSQEAVLGALEETSATLNVRGAVIASVNEALTGVDTIKFNLSSASDTAEPVEVSSAAMVITYLDADQALNIAASDWTATWLTGSGDLLNAGEQVEIVITLTGLTPLLGKSKEFTISVKPNQGAVITINRTMPAELFPSLLLN